MQIQNDLGSDIIMAFDECPPYPATYEYMRAWIEQHVGRTMLRGTYVQKNKGYLVLFKVGNLKN